MIRLCLPVVALLAFVSPVVAEECSDAVRAEAIGLTDTFKKHTQRAIKLTSRLGAQQFSIDELPEDARSRVSPPPEAPTMTEGMFDADGALLWACDADGNPTPDVEIYNLALGDFSAMLDTYEEAIDARAQEISDLANPPAATEPDVAEAEPETQPESEPEPETPDVADADPELPEPPASDEEGEGTDEETPPATAEAEPETDEGGTEIARRDPLRDPNNENLFRRVISLPKATVRATPDDDAAQEGISTFSVLYVFDENTSSGRDWLEVGRSLRDGPQGWIDVSETLNWSSMLVMEFAPKGKRSDVLFFDSDVDLVDMVKDFTYAEEAGRMYTSIESERARLADAPDSTPSFDPRLVAMEPRGAISYEDQPYLLPILDFRQEQLFDNLYDTTLLKVAAVPADAETVASKDAASLQAQPSDEAVNDGVFRVGVVFVVDTTVSMQPFIDRTYQTIQSFYDSFQQYESASFITFGLVGFRDEVSDVSEIEYTTKIFQPLDVDAPANVVLANMGQMREAKAASIDFKEDAFAGVIEAIEKNDWDPYDAKIIFLITDASARTGADPRAKYADYTPQAVQQLANGNGVAVIPIHLATPANARNGDLQIGELQYRELAITGDINTDKYFQLDAADDALFASEMQKMTRDLARAIFEINATGVAQNTDRGDIEFEEVPSGEVGGIAAVLAGEVFRAQLESLAAATNGTSPNFLAGWTADRDLLDPDVTALEVSVFLTRNQLSTLDKRLGDIVDAFRSAEDDPQAFFDRLQFLAAETATDPDLAITAETEVMRTLLPAFLQNLPYRSEALDLRREDWVDESIADQARFIEVLEGKRQIYQDIFEDTDEWQSFGEEDPLLHVTPVKLKNLP